MGPPRSMPPRRGAGRGVSEQAGRSVRVGGFAAAWGPASSGRRALPDRTVRGRAPAVLRPRRGSGRNEGGTASFRAAHRAPARAEVGHPFIAKKARLTRKARHSEGRQNLNAPMSGARLDAAVGSDFPAAGACRGSPVRAEREPELRLMPRGHHQVGHRVRERPQARVHGAAVVARRRPAVRGPGFRAASKRPRSGVPAGSFETPPRATRRPLPIILRPATSPTFLWGRRSG